MSAPFRNTLVKSRETIYYFGLNDQQKQRLLCLTQHSLVKTIVLLQSPGRRPVERRASDASSDLERNCNICIFASPAVIHLPRMARLAQVGYVGRIVVRGNRGIQEALPRYFNQDLRQDEGFPRVDPRRPLADFVEGSLNHKFRNSLIDEGGEDTTKQEYTERRVLESLLRVVGLVEGKPKPLKTPRARRALLAAQGCSFINHLIYVLCLVAGVHLENILCRVFSRLVGSRGAPAEVDE